jgi:hypothetical protein
MSDLVKRLNMVDATMHPMTLVIIAREAANEIERLRMLLEAGGGRYWEGRYRDEAALVDKLQAAIFDWSNSITDWIGNDFVEQIEGEASRKLVKDVLDRAVSEENK